MDPVPFLDQTLRLERLYLRDGPDTSVHFPRGLARSDEADDEGRVWTTGPDVPLTVTVRRKRDRIRGEPGADAEPWPGAVRRALEHLEDHSRDGLSLLVGAAPLRLDEFELDGGIAEHADKYGWVLVAELSDGERPSGDPFRLDLTLARPPRLADPGTGGAVRPLGHGNAPARH
jgi:hypothetical protein